MVKRYSALQRTVPAKDSAILLDEKLCKVPGDWAGVTTGCLQVGKIVREKLIAEGFMTGHDECVHIGCLSCQLSHHTCMQHLIAVTLHEAAVRHAR